MKKALMSVALIGLMFQGCGNNVAQPNTSVQFYTPSKLSVIKKDSKIYIQSLHDHKYLSKNLHKGIKDYFKQDGIFQIVNDAKSADVIISINTFSSHRADNSTDTKYNKSYTKIRETFKNSEGRETGGQDKIVEANFTSSTATLIATVSIYDKKNLEPLVYFNVTPKDTSVTRIGSGDAMYKSKKDFSIQFTQEIIKKLNDLVSTKNKAVNVFLPKKSNAKLKTLLLQSKFKELIAEAKSILPTFDIQDISINKYDEIKKQSSVKGSKVKARDLETDLSNFYIYFMAKESTDISAKNIISVYKAYKKVMFLTKDDTLSLACANSLGRVEFKANRLNINLGDN